MSLAMNNDREAAFPEYAISSIVLYLLRDSRGTMSDGDEATQRRQERKRWIRGGPEVQSGAGGTDPWISSIKESNASPSIPSSKIYDAWQTGFKVAVKAAVRDCRKKVD